MPKANTEIRAMLKEKQIPVYAVAAVMGVHENTVFRRLRFELPDDEKATFRRIINELASQAK
ncbi:MULTISPECIES: hypothetical protein [Ruminococcus]|uniref:Uncharacterized protein n=1 Tax=Ruminococcus flavefaciens TaxID=1265 RepID=A0A315XZF7_RUMFL|nr:MULTISPECIES: hypothetical protein [Ruminococcus]MBR1431940.1 hypothetical protein [Ruminococcus sp.]MBR1823960.1 hypothetical protein [Ruminococcus sp.]PWJ12694.1 hypothetical protein IE37_01779 [Ruminococcus flavefaciens]SSA49332.1 hypothetical protein SAMN02910325_01779 [Ruminococcus flavefaciens]